MKKKGKIPSIFLGVGIAIILLGLVFFTNPKPKEKSIEVLIQQTEEHHNNMARRNLRIAFGELKGFSEGLCEKTRVRLETLKNETQDSEELAEIKQLLEKNNKQAVKTKVIAEEIKELLKEVGEIGIEVDWGR